MSFPFADCHRCPHFPSPHKYFTNCWISDKERSCLGNNKCNIWRLCWTDQVSSSENCSEHLNGCNVYVKGTILRALELESLSWEQTVEVPNFPVLSVSNVSHSSGVVRGHFWSWIQLWMVHSILGLGWVSPMREPVVRLVLVTEISLLSPSSFHRVHHNLNVTTSNKPAPDS